MWAFIWSQVLFWSPFSTSQLQIAPPVSSELESFPVELNFQSNVASLAVKSTLRCSSAPLLLHFNSVSFLSIAMATKENMTSQRGMLKSIQSRVNTLASILHNYVHSCVWRTKYWLVCLVFVIFLNPPPPDRFPTINNLIQRINLRKRRDSLILGTVIGVCTILLLLYAFHWKPAQMNTLETDFICSL